MTYVNCKPYLLDPTQYNTNNSLLASYITSPYNLAFDIHPKLKTNLTILRAISLNLNL